MSEGLEPVVVELQQQGDELCTDMHAIQQSIERLGCEAIAAVVTTTSCFAPRQVLMHDPMMCSLFTRSFRKHWGCYCLFE